MSFNLDFPVEEYEIVTWTDEKRMRFNRNLWYNKKNYCSRREKDEGYRKKHL